MVAGRAKGGDTMASAAIRGKAAAIQEAKLVAADGTPFQSTSGNKASATTFRKAATVQDVQVVPLKNTAGIGIAIAINP